MKRCLALALTTVLAACSGAPKADQAPPATTAAAPATTAAAPAAAEGGFGVPECDQYMKKYVACIESKVPEAMRATLRQALDANKSAWTQAAATPQGKAGLAMACTQAEAASKTAMAAHGCEW